MRKSRSRSTWLAWLRSSMTKSRFAALSAFRLARRRCSGVPPAPERNSRCYDDDGGEAMGRPVPWAANTPVLRQPGTNQVGDIAVVGFAGKHADPWGKEFGQSNTIWLVKIAGLRIVHLGDNGPLREDTIQALDRLVCLLMPM